MSVQRVYVAADVQEGFTATLAKLVDGLVVGDPLDERTEMGSQISQAQMERVRAQSAAAMDAWERALAALES
ncbi:MAG: aldehyde dehydrogenase family protein [Candidatus Velthaea sp.]